MTQPEGGARADGNALTYVLLDRLSATSRNCTMIKIIAALLIALVAASPAAAQSATNDAPSIIPRAKPATAEHEGTFTGDAARRTVDQFAACVLGRRHKPVLQALALPSGSEEQGKALGSLGTKECIASGELNFSAWTFRGSLYTALVRAQFGRKAASFGPEPVDYTKQAPAGNENLPVPEVAEAYYREGSASVQSSAASPDK